MAPFLSSRPPSTRGDVTPNSLDGDDSSDIAIIGFSFQLPEADTSDELWEVMLSGRRTATEFPKDRIHPDKFHGVDDGRQGTIRPQKACFLRKDLGEFDAKFFGMTAEESMATDPQQRILLETTYRALENAGLPMEKISGTDTCVHVGCFTCDYLLDCAKDPERSPKYQATGMAQSILSNRISLFFNLYGASATVDTACSSSLVALDMAAQCLKLGQSSIGIVAGCNLLLGPDTFISLSNLGFLSKDGVCQSFDSRANGYGRGEGFGVLIVKPVADAIRDGDTIRAVIRATGTNQNGRTSLAQPSKDLQLKLIRDTYSRANLDMSRTRFFEAHGTGTAVGDPLEAMAIGNAFAPGRSIDDPIIVGALKSNIGHLEGAAGIAGLIKAILVLESGVIPPIALLEELNKAIDAEFLRLKFPKTTMTWPTPGLRRASVNSFGFGGTNSHVVIDDAYHYLEDRGLVGKHCTRATPPDVVDAVPKPRLRLQARPKTAARHPKLFVWSANEQHVTTKMMETYRAYLEAEPDAKADGYDDALAYTLAHKRSQQGWRSFAVADSVPQLVERLASPGNAIQAKGGRKVGFVFTGQGAQWLGMGKELFVYDVFRDSVLAADKFLQTIGCSWKYADALLGDESCTTRINEPRFAQPVCTILQIALVELLRSFGVFPATVVGHSSGEIAAAYAIGAISRQSAWRIAYFRGVLSSQLAESSSATNTNDGPRGSMMAVGLSAAAAQPYVDAVVREMPRAVLAMACHNSPKNTTISGDDDAVRVLQAKLEAEGVFARVLKVPVAYHSPHMLRLAEDYARMIGTIHASEQALPAFASMVSSVTGDNIAWGELQKPDYWVQNMVSSVRFAESMGRIARNSAKKTFKKLDLSHRKFIGVTDLLELGPHSTLQGPIREIIEAAAASTSSGKLTITYGSALVRGRAATETLLEAIGRAYSVGIDIDLSRVNNPSSGMARGGNSGGGGGGGEEQLMITLPSLPEYPFDHAQSYWDENVISRNIRQMDQPYTEFLGKPAPEWNPLEPRWRNTLKLAAIPWLVDHKINGEILFPAAGMMVMAIEAITQISPDRDAITAYEMRDLALFSALTIPEDDAGAEVQFTLRPSLDSSSKTISWADFSLFTSRSGNGNGNSNDNWVEVCRGAIKAITTPKPKTRGEVDEHVAGLIASAKAESGAKEELAKDLYPRLESVGYGYGPIFQGIETTRTNGCGQVYAQVTTKTPAHGPFSRPFTVIHPCTLDAMLQLTLPAVTLNGARGASSSNSNKKATWIPTFLAKVSYAKDGFTGPAHNGRVLVRTATEQKSGRLCVADVQAVSDEGDDARRVFQVDGVELTMVAADSQANDASSQARVKRQAYDMVYKPDHTMLDNDCIAALIRAVPAVTADETELVRDLRLYNLATFARTTAAVAGSKIPAEATHLHKQYKWMQQTAERAKSMSLPIADAEYQALCDRVTASGRLGEICVRFGSRVGEILRGETDAFTVLGVDNMLGDTNEQFNAHGGFVAPLRQYLEAMAHKSPGMKILEVGAGAGATTQHVLNTLTTQTGAHGTVSRFSRYDVTDIAPAAVQKVSERFGAVPKTSFGLLDVEAETMPSSQFEEHSYDLVIVVNVLHAAKSLNTALANVRSLLKDGGKLVLVEPTDAAATIPAAILGYLPVWWQRAETCATVAQWGRELEAAGFTGTDLVVDGYEKGDDQFATLMISSAAPTTVDGVQENDNSNNSNNSSNNNNNTQTAAFVVSGWDTASASTSTLAELAATKLRETGIADVRVCGFNDVAAQEKLGDDKLVVIVQHSEWLALDKLEGEQFAAFHAALNRATRIMWVAETNGTEASPIGAVQGLARVLRRERVGVVFSTVALDPSRPSLLSGNMEKAVRNFVEGATAAAAAAAAAAADAASYEPELVQVGDSLNIPRTYENAGLNQAIHDYVSDTIERDQPFGERNVKLRVRQPGLLDTLYFEEVAGKGALAANEIEVDVRAVGVNFRDCLICLGRVDQDTIGTECAGVVSAAGVDCKLRVGDRVLVNAVDTFQGRFRCSEKLAVRMPDSMSFAEGGALATNFVTAYHALVRVARLERGESILIHSGAGGTGQAAIQIAQLLGAVVYTTVGSRGKRDLITREYGIPDERILNSRDLSFADDIKRLTGGRGVDVVLNSLAGDALIAGWESVAAYGRFLEIGKKDIFGHSRLPMYQFGRNVSFCAVDLATITIDRPDIIQEALLWLVERFADRRLHMPVPMKAFPISEVEMAFRYLQSGSNAGKVVVEIDPKDIVAAVVKSRANWAFSPNETFVIAGGLGAQGRFIAKWMVDRGARNLVLLSRSGPSKSPKLTAFVDELRGAGANVYCPACSIADAASVRAVVEHCRAANMPPIKGCIQAAMDLRDCFFENMDRDSWVASLQPKVQGSWNLHRELPRDLDFFVFFSSVAAIIGSQGQANYAAGNAYMDELARHRVARGERAVSVNFSMIFSEGFAAENRDAALQFIRTKHVMEQTQDEIFAVLDHYCNKKNNNNNTPLDPSQAQLVLGLELPGDVAARGGDPLSGWKSEPMFANLHQMGASSSASSGAEDASGKDNKGPDLLTRVGSAESLADAADVVAKGLATKLCRVLSLQPEAFDIGQPLHTYGVDSLIAVELRNWFTQALKVDVAIFEILGGATSSTLGRTVAEKVRGA